MGGGGGITPLIVYFNNSSAVLSPPRGVWGHAPPENFGNLDSLRAFMRHSDSHFGADLVAIFYLSTDMQTQYYCDMVECISIAYPVCVIWKAALLLALASCTLNERSM